uniref:Uncharacterized protein n=1 Tax=Hanusia phi TaxID=3032 RepID=A0A7S0E0G9_9CRYP|mmetsp:Transcript_13351/g.30733  ORF Transcript_13351/g.30733 Transcript_13351/m.30733 type:complete len:200 (+) Transcript_13351:134-733(+)|eukprot:764470-Hanusia_phi.AAC.2
MANVIAEHQTMLELGVEQYIDEIANENAVRKGRIVIEPRDPYFITSIDGPGTAMLSRSSSRITGRMLRTMDWPNAGAKLHDAAKVVEKTSTRIFLCLPRPVGSEDIIVCVQRCQNCPYSCIEIILYPTDRCNILSLAKARQQYEKIREMSQMADGRNSPEKDLEISETEMRGSFDYSPSMINYDRAMLPQAMEVEQRKG